MDCTNHIDLHYKNKAINRNSNMKGQWKRRARMQAMGIAEGMTTQQNKQGDEQLKKSRRSTDENSKEDCEPQVWKKTKSSTKEVDQQFFEVEETSRDWSQVYK